MHEAPTWITERGINAARHNGVNTQLEDSFHNAVDVGRIIQHEKPWHRVAIFMATNGKNASDIARALGRSPQTVSELLRQPWAQERIQREIAESGRDNLQELMSVYGPNALLQVIDLGTSAKSEQVKLAANREVLDRWLGKPKESVVVTNKAPTDKSDEELKADVNRIINNFGTDNPTTNERPNSQPSGIPDPAVG